MFVDKCIIFVVCESPTHHICKKVQAVVGTVQIRIFGHIPQVVAKLSVKPRHVFLMVGIIKGNFSH